MYFLKQQFIKGLKQDNTKKYFIFLFGGLFNTLLTYFIYYYLSNLFSYKLSYTIAYIIGIIYAYFYNTVFVFQSKITGHSFLIYPIIYLIQYIISIIIIYFSIEILFINVKFAPLISIVLLIPISYFLNKKFLQNKIKQI